MFNLFTSMSYKELEQVYSNYMEWLDTGYIPADSPLAKIRNRYRKHYQEGFAFIMEMQFLRECAGRLFGQKKLEETKKEKEIAELENQLKSYGWVLEGEGAAEEIGNEGVWIACAWYQKGDTMVTIRENGDLETDGNLNGELTEEEKALFNTLINKKLR